MQDAIDDIVKAATNAGIPVGMLATNREEIATRDGWSVDFLAIGLDMAMLSETA